jgi:ABC-type branched-subunit amino acid transport system substrate-binding protein
MVALLNALRKVTIRAAALVGIVALAACETTTVAGGPTIDASEPVTVALLVPASGGGGGATIAASLENAARLAVSDLQGAQIDLRVYDTGGNPQRAAQVAQQAVSEGARIILGPVFAEEANATGVAVASQGVNVLSFSNNPAIAGGNVFVLGQTFQNTATRLVRFANGRGRGNIFIVHGRDTAETLGRDAIQGAINSSGARLAGTASFDLSQQGVVNAIPSIANQIRLSNANAVFLTSGTAGALPFLADLLPANGVNPAVTQYIGLQRFDIPSSALSLSGLQGGWFALPDPSTSQQFQSRYTAAYGAPPHPLAALAYDGIAAIGALVATGQSNALTAQALTRPGGFVGANGIFRLTSSGSNERGLAVAQVQNNQVTVIEPAPRSFGGAGF